MLSMVTTQRSVSNAITYCGCSKPCVSRQCSPQLLQLSPLLFFAQCTDILMFAMVQNLYAAASLNEKNRATYSAGFNYPCAVNLQTNAAPATGCKPVDQYFNGSAVGFYNSTSVYDDLAWAATWLYKATNDPGYLADAEK